MITLAQRLSLPFWFLLVLIGTIAGVIFHHLEFGSDSYWLVWHPYAVETIAALLLLGLVWAAARGWEHAERTQRRTAKQLALVADLAPVGTWQWDTQNNQVCATGICTELFQLPSRGAINF